MHFHQANAIVLSLRTLMDTEKTLLPYNFDQSRLEMCYTLHTSNRLLSFEILFNKYVALADQCCHQSARFRHRNMRLIRVDHLPLGKL